MVLISTLLRSNDVTFSYLYWPFGYPLLWSSSLLPTILLVIFFLLIYIRYKSSSQILGMSSCWLYGCKYCLLLHGFHFYSLMIWLVEVLNFNAIYLMWHIITLFLDSVFWFLFKETAYLTVLKIFLFHFMQDLTFTLHIYLQFTCNGFLCMIWRVRFHLLPSDQIRSVAQLCPTLCDPMNHSTPGLPVHHQLPEFTETHVHRASDAIQPSHPLSSPSPLAPNPSQHQSLFQWVNSSHEVAKVPEFQL